MKGIPALSLNRLKRAAVVAGVGALVVGGAMLGSTQAHAAPPVAQFGSGTGLTLSPATGPVTTTPTYSSAACPSGFQGSAVLLVIDPTTPAGTSIQNINADQPAPPALSVATAFTGSWDETVGQELHNGIDINAGSQFEVADFCYTAANATGPGEFGSSTFVTISADGTSYTANQSLGGGGGTPTNVSVALTASPNPATSGQSVTLTATVSPASATGTIQFENNGTNINGPAAISGGSASTSTTFSGITTATMESLTAVYTPTGNFAATTPGSLSLTVNPAAPNSGTIPLAVSVPATGSFTLTVDSSDVVTLTASGLTATGTTTPITVADSRNSYPGWSVSGQDGAWTGTGTAAGGTFSGNQLGWAPVSTTLAPGATLSSPVTAASPGLGSAAPLASAPSGLGNGFGTSTFSANLTLAIPAAAPAGPYTSGLTISAVTTNP